MYGLKPVPFKTDKRPDASNQDFSTRITSPAAFVTKRPLVWSSITMAFPNGSRTTAQRPIGISKGPVTVSPPAPLKRSSASSTFATKEVHFRTKVRVQDKLCLRFGHPQPCCFRRPPKNGVTQSFGVEP